jgi:hypothetical protein
MQAALGSKAKDTGRGDNFRELVRTGCHEARVKVCLWCCDEFCGGGGGAGGRGAGEWELSQGDHFRGFRAHRLS